MRAEQQVLSTIGAESAAGASLHVRVGELLGLSAGVATEVDLVDRLEAGLPASAVQNLRALVGLSAEEVYQLISPRRTLNRREALHQRLSAEEADRAVRVARIAARAQQVFSAKPAYAIEWLRTAKSSLGGRTPIALLASDAGARAVEELLLGIEYGQFG